MFNKKAKALSGALIGGVLAITPLATSATSNAATTSPAPAAAKASASAKAVVVKQGALQTLYSIAYTKHLDYRKAVRLNATSKTVSAKKAARDAAMVNYAKGLVSNKLGTRTITPFEVEALTVYSTSLTSASKKDPKNAAKARYARNGVAYVKQANNLLKQGGGTGTSTVVDENVKGKFVKPKVRLSSVTCSMETNFQGVKSYYIDTEYEATGGIYSDLRNLDINVPVNNKTVLWVTLEDRKVSIGQPVFAGDDGKISNQVRPDRFIAAYGDNANSKTVTQMSMDSSTARQVTLKCPLISEASGSKVVNNF